MLAGRITAPGQIELQDHPEPELRAPGEIIFEPQMACLCGSDLPFFRGEKPSYPLEWGHSLHEMIGTVVATSGRKFRVGEPVLAVPEEQKGLFERFALGEERAVALDPRLPDEIAVLAQPLGTVLFAIRKLPNLWGLNVVVVGQGPIGQLFCAALRNAGARQVIAVDLLEPRLQTSRTMGATDVISNASEDPVAAVSRLTQGRLADLVVEAVGHRDQALNLCFDLCRQEGRILSFGVPPEAPVQLNWSELFFKNVTILASVHPEFETDFPLAMRMIAEGRIDVSPLITHRFPLRDIQTAFETFCDRKDGAQKVMVRFGE